MHTDLLDSVSLSMELLLEDEEREPPVSIRFGGIAVTGSAAELRPNGVFIETSARLPYGTRVDVVLPDLDHEALQGVVRWSNARGIGIHYESLRPRQLRAIHRVMHRLH